MFKIAKFIVLPALFVVLVITFYFAFESFSIKKNLNYEKLEEIPYINWYNIRSGIFGSMLKITHNRNLVSYDQTKYLTIISPKDDYKNNFGAYKLIYFINGANNKDEVNTELYKYSAVFRTRFKKVDYLLFLQEHLQKDGKVGLIIVSYPANLIQGKTIGQFIKIATNQNILAPVFSPVYKFESFEICEQQFRDKNYCNWLIFKQNTIYKLIKKWGDTGIIPIDMMKYPLVIDANKLWGIY